MKINTLGYSVKQGLKNIRRNLLFSLASIGTIVACLFLFGIFYSIVLNMEKEVESIESSLTISVFFDEGIDETRIMQIGEELKTIDNIDTINFISADKAWNMYVQDVYGGNKDGTAKSLNAINRLVGYASLGVILILLCVSLFLISNTITIGISVRKEEIAIMKLIGAKDIFVRAPFLVEGVMIGLVGSIVPLGILYFMYNIMTQYLTEHFTIVANLIEFVPVGRVYTGLAPISVLLGVGVGFFGSLITTHKHLKV